MAVHLPELVRKNLGWNEYKAVGKNGTPADLTPPPQVSACAPEIWKSLLESRSLQSPEFSILLIKRHRCAVPDHTGYVPSVTKHSI